tara:strand:- start:625 stop:1296 length:672 start_codon:yes stop_codon:yes gene_type:complete
MNPEFIKSLIAAQSQFDSALKSAKNQRFARKDGSGGGYADLSSVLNACLSALHANNLFLTQTIVDKENGLHLQTVVMHGSGSQIDCVLPLIMDRDDMQALGAAITYARRYGIVTLLGITQEDDDGNSCTPDFSNKSYSKSSGNNQPAQKKVYTTLEKGAEVEVLSDGKRGVIKWMNEAKVGVSFPDKEKLTYFKKDQVKLVTEDLTPENSADINLTGGDDIPF